MKESLDLDAVKVNICIQPIFHRCKTIEFASFGLF